MLIKLICVGKIKDKALAAKIAEFGKRIQFDAKLEVLELKDSSREKESARLAEIIDKEQGFVFILSEDGKEFSSTEFAERLNSIDKKMIFVIGGPYGMTQELKDKADILLSLSQMTFTHEMARLFLTEQIFRAISIIKGRKYHNE